MTKPIGTIRQEQLYSNRYLSGTCAYNLTAVLTNMRNLAVALPRTPVKEPLLRHLAQVTKTDRSSAMDPRQAMTKALSGGVEL